METKSIIPEKKIYHTPVLQTFGAVKDKTNASNTGNKTDGGNNPYSLTYIPS